MQYKYIKYKSPNPELLIDYNSQDFINDSKIYKLDEDIKIKPPISYIYGTKLYTIIKIIICITLLIILYDFFTSYF